MLAASLLALAACKGPAPAGADQSSDAFVLGTDLGPSPERGPAPVAKAGMDHALPVEGHGGRGMQAAGVQLVHEGHEDAHTQGTVNSVDVTQRKINLSHQAIPDLGWPPMTMDFSVAPSVNLSAIKPGSRVNVTLEKGKDGMYQIQSVQPAGQGR